MAEVARTLKAEGQAVATEFIGPNGEIRNDRRVGWRRSPDGAAYAAELLSSYPATIRLEKRYKDDNSLVIGSNAEWFHCIAYGLWRISP